MEKILVYGMTDTAGGMESYMMNMYRNIPKDKIKFDFVTDWETMAYEDEVRKNGSAVYHIPKKSESLFGQFKAFSKILKEHEEYKKVYFNIMNAGAFLTMLAPILYGRKIIVHSHNDFDEKVRLHKIFKGFMNCFADVKLACSYGAAKHMFTKRDVKKENYTIINNAIEVERFIFDNDKRQQKRKELGIEDKFTVLHVGRIVNQKNPIFIIDTFSELLKIRPDSVLLYVGAGDMQAQVKARAEELGLNSSIRFLGERNDIPELLFSADVFLFPSIFEGFGIVAVEAQAADLMCFVSDRLPKCVKATEKIRFLNVEQSAYIWAKEISQYQVKERTNRADDITKSGYNIKNEIEKLISIIE